VTVDQTGSLASVTRHDYLPFGEELQAGSWGRTTAQGFAGDSVKQKYTGYERDGETSLNFAEARYHSDAMGRFTSVDPLSSSAKLTDPQTLNRYSYVSNNPVTFSDPSGMLGVSGMYCPGCAGIVNGNEGNATWVDDFNATPEVVADAGWQTANVVSASGAEVASGALDGAQADGSGAADSNNKNARYVLIVGDPGIGRHNAGNNFERSAATRQAELEKTGAEVIIERASSVQDFNRAITTHGTLNGVEYFGHAGTGVLFIGENPSNNTNLNSGTISQLSNGNLARDAQITLHGCNTAVDSHINDSIGRLVAQQLQRTTFGYSGTLSFSPNRNGSANATIPPNRGPIYMSPDRGVRIVGFEPYVPVRLP
jgi:RHS repeat-associated protein